MMVYTNLVVEIKAFFKTKAERALANPSDVQQKGAKQKVTVMKAEEPAEVAAQKEGEEPGKKKWWEFGESKTSPN